MIIKASNIKVFSNISAWRRRYCVGGFVTSARLMQSRALVARVSSARGARCASLTAPVGVLMEITLHLQHHGSSCALSIYQRAPHNIEHLAVIASVFALALRLCFETILVSAGALLSSLPALCFRLCRHSASRLCRCSALSALVWFLVSALHF